MVQALLACLSQPGLSSVSELRDKNTFSLGGLGSVCEMASSALSHHRSKDVLLQLWAASFLSPAFISLSGKLGEVETVTSKSLFGRIVL